MSRENPEDLADLVHRGRDKEWLQQAAHNRRRQRRRRLSIGAVVVVLLLVAGFLLDDGPRRSGMLDAVGITCGEYLTDSGTAQQQIFEPWGEHPAALEDALPERPTENGDFDADAFQQEVEQVAAQLDAEPVQAVFRGWTQPTRWISAEPVGGRLLIGHHDETWTVTDRVSVVSPETGESRWSVQLEHPVQEDWQEPERMLYGVGAAGDRLLLQTPAINGDTDLVVIDTRDESDRECVRLAGDVDPVEVLQEQPRAWPVVMNLNLGRLSETGFLLLHGLDAEQDTPLLASQVDISTHEIGPAREYEEVYPPDSEYSSAQLEALDVQADLRELEVEEIQPLGDAHYLLTWDAGYIILEQS